MNDFNPKEVVEFKATSWNIVEGVLNLNYSLDENLFCEQIVFDSSYANQLNADDLVLTRLIDLLHSVVGVSYYKLACPPVMHIESHVVGASEVALIEQLYVQGLSEFAYTNQIELTGRTEFVYQPASDDVEIPRHTSEPQNLRPLVPIGGGKDSFVTWQAFVDSGVEPVAFVVGRAPALQRALRALGDVETVVLERKLDDRLHQLSAAGGYNGHVPVTAIVSTLAAIAAHLSGCDAVALSCERSASEPNLVWNGVEVNHQWAKSWTAEQLVGAAVSEATGGAVQVFSMLRQCSELRIAGRFAATHKYLPVFTSCNSVFRINEQLRNQSWCGDCPKCRFVFLALAPWLKPDVLTSVFGANLLDSIDQLSGFAELCGVSGNKPFECVGEIAECRVALDLCNKSADWHDAVVVRALLDKWGTDELVSASVHDEVMGMWGDSAIPQRYQQVCEKL